MHSKLLIVFQAAFLFWVPAAAQDFPEKESNIDLCWDKIRNILSVSSSNWPAGKPTVIIESLSELEKPRHQVTKVKLDGYEGEIKWLHDRKGLKVNLPLEEIKDNSFKLEITLGRENNYLPKDNPNYKLSIQRGIEPVPVPEYHWASEEAYEAMNDMKYGIRIHWGIYSSWEIEASWDLMWNMSNEKRMEYWDLFKRFNPGRFDADYWMSWFKENGLKMFAFTTKHHDGFCMFDTKTTVAERIHWAAPGGPEIEPSGMDFDIMQSPYKRDIVKELCEAARKFDIKIDLYYSNIDWFDADQRGFASVFPGKRASDGTNATDNSPGTFSYPGIPEFTDRELKRGMQRHRDQLKEILSNYGRIDMLCLDMWLDSVAWPEMRKTILELRKIQPDVMFRCRNIGNYGDYYTPERWVPDHVENTNMPWFVIYPLGNLFAYDPEAANYKGGNWIVNNVIDAASKGGNFMVCIGPDKDGLFHPAAIKSVEEAGDWFRVNGEAIFATRPWKVFGEGPTADQLLSSSTEKKTVDIEYTFKDIRFTRSKDRETIYVFVMAWPGNGRTVTVNSLSENEDPGLAINNVTLLGYNGRLEWLQDNEGLKVTFPDEKPCHYACVLKVRLQED